MKRFLNTQEAMKVLNFSASVTDAIAANYLVFVHHCNRSVYTQTSMRKLLLKIVGAKKRQTLLYNEKNT